MGTMSIGGPDVAPDVLSGSVTGTASSTASNTSFKYMFGKFNATLSGTWAGGTFQLQKSFDSGQNWVPATTDSLGTAANYTANASVIVEEDEPGVAYRWQCTAALTSGTTSWRLAGGERVS